MRTHYSSDAAPDVLTNGAWQVQAGVRVWVPNDGPHPACGTESGYYRHRRQLDESACGECLTAHRVAERARSRRRQAVS